MIEVCLHVCQRVKCPQKRALHGVATDLLLETPQLTTPRIFYLQQTYELSPQGGICKTDTYKVTEVVELKSEDKFDLLDHFEAPMA